MRQLLFSILFTGCFLNSYSQDTIRQYLKNDFTITVKDSAAMIQEIITPSWRERHARAHKEN